MKPRMPRELGSISCRSRTVHIFLTRIQILVCIPHPVYMCTSSADLLALAYHNAQLQASAFREEFDTEAFEDLTRPKYDMVHKV